MSNKHILGKPLYKRDDIVKFKVTLHDEEFLCCGRVSIVDSYGIFVDNSEPYYDIYVDNFADTNAPCFVKHIKESAIIEREIQR